MYLFYIVHGTFIDTYYIYGLTESLFEKFSTTVIFASKEDFGALPFLHQTSPLKETHQHTRGEGGSSGSLAPDDAGRPKSSSGSSTRRWPYDFI